MIGDDPHPLHSQPLAPRFVNTTRVDYFAVYPNGRRCSVSLRDAQLFGEMWRKEGVRIVTRVQRTAVRVIGDLEESL